jgi:prostatic aicd phosphatase
MAASADADGHKAHLWLQVLLNTATAFLQGLYPPLESTNPSIASQSLNNGSTYTNPLNGYQYVVLHGENENSPNTIWIKGDDACPAYTTAAKSFKKSDEFKERAEATKQFYEGFWNILDSVYNYKPENMSYANAYDIFDLIHVATIHNSSMTGNVTAEELFQLRTLADSAEWASNYNETQPMRSIGGRTLAGAIIQQLNKTVTTKGKLKFSLLAGSYDTFQAFFGLTNLTSAAPSFYGLPDYASTIAFELFTSENVTEFPADTSDLNVRFLFRNGSNDGAPLKPFPLFGQSSESLPWDDFATKLQNRAVNSLEQWCGLCASTEDFCQQYNSTFTSGSSSTGESEPPPSDEDGDGGISKAVAGVIGAMVTLAVVAVCGLAFWLVRRRKRGLAAAAPVSPTEKPGSLSSGSKAEP